jgi:hypothetical protein
MLRIRIPKGDPRLLRAKATELKLKAEGLLREVDELERQAAEAEAFQRKNER